MNQTTIVYEELKAYLEGFEVMAAEGRAKTGKIKRLIATYPFSKSPEYDVFADDTSTDPTDIDSFASLAEAVDRYNEL